VNYGLDLKTLFALLRIKHYIKNLLVFIPLIFSYQLFNAKLLIVTIWGYFAFCFLASGIYIVNDLKDVHKDRLHPKKQYRPIASGKIRPLVARIMIFFCVVLSIICNLMTGSLIGLLFLVTYFFMNIGYSYGLKNVPIIDIIILTVGFILRVVYGASLVEIPVSSWLYLTIIVISLFMGLGKRRNELAAVNPRGGVTRSVLHFYNYSFLDKNMYVCVSLTNTFYALWAVDHSSPYMIWTVPIVILVLMKYSLDIEGHSDGDPVEVVSNDISLLLLIAFYIISALCILYS
jgi:decaprenyl-phosphate phosphoribosyltransferase